MARNGPHEPAPMSFGFPGWPSPTPDVWQAWNSSFSAVNAEWMNFVNRRVNEDFALPQHVIACKGPEEVWRVYAEFFQKAFDDYQKEFAELANLGSKAASEAASARGSIRRSRLGAASSRSNRTAAFD